MEWRCSWSTLLEGAYVIWHRSANRRLLGTKYQIKIDCTACPLSIFLSLSLFLTVYISISVTIPLSFSLSVCPPVPLFISIYMNIFTYLPLSSPLSLFIFKYECQSVSLSLYVHHFILSSNLWAFMYENIFVSLFNLFLYAHLIPP